MVASVAFEGVNVMTKIMEQGSLQVFRDLRRDMFVEEEERRLYGFIKRFLREHGDLPHVETAEQETGLNLPETKEPLSFYLDQLKDRALHNAVLPFIGEQRDVLTDGRPREIIDIWRRGLSLVAQFDTNMEVVPISQAMSETMDTMDDYATLGTPPGVTTGYETLDDKTLGHQPGDLNFIVARPNVGKTMMLVRNALKAHEEGWSILFISTEMPKPAICHRILSIESGINTKYMRSAQFSDPRLSGIDIRSTLERVAAEIQQWRGFSITNASMDKKVSGVASVIEQFHPDIVFIDGMYLLKTEYDKRAKTDRFSGIAYVADELRQVALTMNVPIVCTSQLSRDAGKDGKRATLENIGFSDAIGQLASMVWVLKLPNDENPNQRLLQAIKAREGGWGDLLIRYEFKPPCFDEIEWREPRNERSEQRETRPVSDPS